MISRAHAIRGSRALIKRPIEQYGRSAGRLTSLPTEQMIEAGATMDNRTLKDDGDETTETLRER
jgi:hypothetical protein